MEYISFLDYMENEFFKQFTGIKDQIPEAADEWFEGLSDFEWLEYGDEYAKIIASQIEEQAKQEIVDQFYEETEKQLQLDQEHMLITLGNAISSARGLLKTLLLPPKITKND